MAPTQHAKQAATPLRLVDRHTATAPEGQRAVR